MRRRYRGMYIAELLTKSLSLGELTFEYPEEAPFYIKDLKEIVDGRAGRNEAKVDLENPDDEVCRQDYVSTDDISVAETGDVIDSDDEDFPAYEIPESERNLKREDGDEGQKPVQSPHYIRDCLEDLNEQESYAKFEAAFGVLNSLIRSRALAYDEIAPVLVKRLIFLTDRYRTENFQERRLEMVVSCLVMSPQLVSVAADIMFSRSCSMFGRYLILEAITKAAAEISNSGDKSHFDVTLTSNEKSSPEPKFWQKIIEERVAAKTKYNAKNSKPQKLRKNNFCDLASSFFYPLAAIEQYREHLDLLNRDYNLLAKILFVLANIVCCAGNCAPSLRMSKTLNDYAFPLQRHKEAVVRQAVLYCYCSICTTLSAPVLVQFFSASELYGTKNAMCILKIQNSVLKISAKIKIDALVGWFHYARNTGETDPSVSCREMAKCASSIVADKISETEFSQL
ncbi:unnamed protein product [Enterobius vermicularis]|uniref:Telomere_reg-2 domain-containing protein n=1 Tax=Enterobius vermicularis TaxID=51028 RepID=A0A0N4V6U2_ENTVE|nr:unnamed protein product [Enterobius vermicularis]